MKHALCSILILLPFVLFGQEIGFYSGVNYNTFFDFEEEYGNNHTNYTSKAGYILGLKLSEVKNEIVTFDFAISYEKYAGYLFTSSGGRGGGNYTSADVELDRININIIPFHIRFKESNLKLDISFSYSFKVNHNLVGKKTFWNILPTNESTPLNNETEDFLNKSRTAINLALQYKIALSKSINLIPRYEINYGLTSDILDAQANIFNIIQRLSIGLSLKI